MPEKEEELPQGEMYPYARPPRRAAWASQQAAEMVCGRKLPDELFLPEQIWGRRVIVVLEPPDTMKGLIYIPDRCQHPKVTGWVIAAGQDVGIPESGPAGYSPFGPHELLYRKVLVSKYAGFPLTFSAKVEDPHYAELKDCEKEDTTPIHVVTDFDIFWSY